MLAFSFFPATGDVDTLNVGTLVTDNVAAMGPYDWIALVFATTMVALAVNRELKDIQLVSVAVEQAGDKLGHCWRNALRVLNGARRWVFLVLLVANIPLLIVMKGGG